MPTFMEKGEKFSGVKTIEKKKEVRVLGHTFREMTANERYGFGGCSLESLICYLDSDKYILIYDPTDQTLTEIDYEGDMDEKIWKRS